MTALLGAVGTVVLTAGTAASVTSDYSHEVRVIAYAVESCRNNDRNINNQLLLNSLPESWTGDMSAAGKGVTVHSKLDLDTSRTPDGALATVRLHGVTSTTQQDPCADTTARSVGNSSVFFRFTVDAPTIVHVRIATSGKGSNALQVCVCAQGGSYITDGPLPGLINQYVALQPGEHLFLYRINTFSDVASNADVVVEATFDPEVPSWDWEALPRYGKDDDEDGKIDSYAPDGIGEIEPAEGFELRLFASPCPVDDGQTLRWVVDGVTVAEGSPAAVCEHNHLFPSEGDYQVSLDTFVNGELTASAPRTVGVNDILMVSIGDSVASGEGALEVLEPVTGWQNDQCHRSAAAGPAVAARLLENADPHSSVTFVHLACSGAEVLDGLLAPYDGIIPGSLLPPQLEEAKTLAGERQIDVLTISIGANDVRFSDIVKDCFFLYVNCSKGAVPKTFKTRLADLVSRYAELGAAIDTAGIPSNRVYLTEYYDALHDENLAPCTNILEDLVDVPDLEITPKEIEWASSVMMPALNQAGADAAAANGWNRVDGMFLDFGPHGYCAANGWITQLGTSVAEQGDENGTLHPNWNGHSQSYGPRLANAIASRLQLEISSFPVPRP